MAAFKGHVMNLSAARHFDFKPFGERIDNGCAHAVQPAAGFVSALTALILKFAAGADFGENDLDRGDAFGRVKSNGNASAVVRHADAAIGVDHDENAGAVTCARFINGIVGDFVDEVVQAARRGVANIHAWPRTYVFDALKHLDLGFAILIGIGGTR